MTNSARDHGILDGLTVIDASTVIAGPLTATLLSDYGARVIKVEQPGVGDPTRTTGSAPELHTWWNFLGRNREAVTCNLASEEGRELFRGLIRSADVLIENLRPGLMNSWGLDYANLSAVNERLVMLRVSGFGQEGPYAHRPGYGTLAEAYAGYAYVTGSPDGPPVLPGVPTADTMGAFAGAAAILMALYRRGIDGRGREIDLSLYGPVLYACGMNTAEASIVGLAPERRGTNLPAVPGSANGDNLRGSVRTGDDKWVAYSVLSPRLVERVFSFLNPGVERDPSVRIDKGALNRQLRAWIGERTRAAVLDELEEVGIPIAPVYSSLDLLEDPHFVARGEFARIPLPEGREARVPIAPFRFDGAGGRHRTAAPGLGEHNDQVYRDLLALPPAEVERLRAAGVI